VGASLSAERYRLGSARRPRPLSERRLLVEIKDPPPLAKDPAMELDVPVAGSCSWVVDDGVEGRRWREGGKDLGGHRWFFNFFFFFFK
jgi:hypothetical protein